MVLNKEYNIEKKLIRLKVLRLYDDLLLGFMFIPKVILAVNITVKM